MSIITQMMVGTGTFSANQTPGSIEYLVVAGGGSGGYGARGNYDAGGGGAGGFLSSFIPQIQPGITLSLSVGAGGAGGNNGQNSTLDTLIAHGGGFGGSPDSNNGMPGNGGSGGGGGQKNYTYRIGLGVAGQGHDGAYMGGGGGAGGGFGAGIYSEGGGVGLASSITGTAKYYAHGGNRGNWIAANGEVNTGNGGDGGTSNNTSPGNGGSGIVVLRYPDTFPLATSTTGNPTITNVGGYKIYSWTTVGAGSITF